MASVTRSILRPAHRALSSGALLRPLSTTPAFRAVVGNAPPMEPHKQRTNAEMGVGEIEGAEFRIEPMRRVGEDDKTMRARLTYQSRKRGTLESDLLLSTFADTYLPTMTREQMAQYDLFLDENDWDIYYWATQEPPSPTSTSASSSSSTSSSTTASATSATSDTSSASYGSGAEAATAESSTSEPTGGSPREGDILEGKGSNAAAAAAAASEEPYRKPGEGEWAQTVGTFKPAYRPVPARWRDSAVLQLLREHVRSRAGKEGGMGFMPALKS